MGANYEEKVFEVEPGRTLEEKARDFFQDKRWRDGDSYDAGTLATKYGIELQPGLWTKEDARKDVHNNYDKWDENAWAYRLKDKEDQTPNPVYLVAAFCPS